MNTEKLFENLEITGVSDVETIRQIVELSFFESCLDREKIKPAARVARRIRAILTINNEQPIPLHLDIIVQSAFSNFGSKKSNSPVLAVRFLDLDSSQRNFACRDEKIIALPAGAFSNEAKKRIFSFLSTSLREDLKQFQEIRDQLAYPDKPIKKLSDMLQNLARQFGVRDPFSKEEKMASLRASWADEKSKYDKLKEQLQNMPSEEDTKRLEGRMKQIQKNMSALASELQHLQNVLKATPTASAGSCSSPVAE